MSYYCYIIYSLKLDKYYVGHTDDIAKRLQEHLAGMSVFTSKAQDWQLKHTEVFESREEAAKREREIKRKKSTESRVVI